MTLLARLPFAALVLAILGAAPGWAAPLGFWPGPVQDLGLSLPQGVEQIALKCRAKGNCGKFKKGQRRHHARPGENQNGPKHGQDKPKHGKDRPKHGQDKPKNKKPLTLPFKPTDRPGGICIGGKIVAQRCQCKAGEAKLAVRKRVTLCQDTNAGVSASAIAGAGAGAAAAATGANAASPAVEFVPDEVLLILPLGNSAQSEEQIAARYNLNILQRLDFTLLASRIVRCRIPDGRSVSAVLLALQGDGQINAAQPNYYYRRQAAGSAPFSSGIQYALEKLQVDAAHTLATGRGALIAVVDTGIDKRHPDLVAAVEASFDATDGAPAPDDPHGTAIAGIIAAHGAIQGVAPDAKVLDVRVFEAGADGAGPFANTMFLLRGLQWADEHGARILNLSLAGPRDDLTGLAIAALARKNIVIVAAAGNAGASAPSAYPAAFDDVIAVTATDLRDALYAAANHGMYIAVAAPGVDVIAPAFDETYQMNSGTSFAAAHVSGVIALMLERGAKTSIRDIRAVLQSAAKDLGPPGIDEQFGAGRISALAVLKD
jgi:subtilisin family serine protease